MIFVCSSTLINASRNTLSGVVVGWLLYFFSVVCVQQKEGHSGVFSTSLTWNVCTVLFNATSLNS